jgi:hypothetical protein
LFDADDLTAAVNPGQTLLLGKLVDIIGLEDPTTEASFLALMLFVLSLGCLMCYFALGWAMNVIANVSFCLASKTVSRQSLTIDSLDTKHQSTLQHDEILAPSEPTLL